MISIQQLQKVWLGISLAQAPRGARGDPLVVLVDAFRVGEQRSGRARTPIVALTADALEAGKRSCKEAGMDGFLTKPVDPAELEECF